MRPGSFAGLRREHEKNDGVDEVIQNGGSPDGGCVVSLERSFQSMRTERSQRDRKETERGREAKDGDVQIASSNRRTRGATGPEGTWGRPD